MSPRKAGPGCPGQHLCFPASTTFPGPSLYPPSQLTYIIWGNEMSFDLKLSIKVILDITDERTREAETCFSVTD